MGISSDGILAFGFDMDLEDECPEFLKSDDEDGDNMDLADFLAREAGLPEWSSSMTSAESSNYFDAKNKLEAECPVEIIMHCSYDYPMYILAVRGTKVSASRGYPEALTAEQMFVAPVDVDAAKEWCEKHGVEWKEPSWILASIMG